MKAQDTVPLITTLAPVATLAPPLVLGGLIGLGLLWLFSEDKEAEAKPKTPEDPAPFLPVMEAPADPLPVKTTPATAIPEPRARAKAPPPAPPATAKRITREDLADALAYGERRFTRKEAVAALEALGFRKTAAYKALSPDGKFADLIESTPDGLVEWRDRAICRTRKFELSPVNPR